MKTYKYTDETNRVVHIIDEDGKSRSSCLASTVEEGNILPADPPTAEQLVAEASRQKIKQDFAAHKKTYPTPATVGVLAERVKLLEQLLGV